MSEFHKSEDEKRTQVDEQPPQSNTEEEKVIKKWDELDLNPDILRGIYAYGFETPSPIQCKAILPIMQGRDIIAQAQSGTGKTATFTIGALSRIDLESNTTQVLVLSPTRELSMQSKGVFSSLGEMMNGLKTQLLVGGSSVDRDMKMLTENTPHVAIGCAGRIQDMIRRGALVTNTIKVLIVDEADEMLAFGFKEQLQSIIQTLSTDAQIALFSATLPNFALDIVDKIMRNPVHIIVKKEQLTLEGIQQYYVAMEDDMQKYAVLKDLYTKLNVSQCIIYCNSIERVQELAQAMINDGFPICCIHSNMDKKQREKAINDFRKGSQRILISSNVTARGIDVQQVGVVLNFDICKNTHTYLHRIGRSGRWGRKGVGINFVTRRDISKLRNIESYYHTQIDELPMNFMEHIM